MLLAQVETWVFVFVFVLKGLNSIFGPDYAPVSKTTHVATRTQLVRAATTVSPLQNLVSLTAYPKFGQPNGVPFATQNLVNLTAYIPAGLVSLHPIPVGMIASTIAH